MGLIEFFLHSKNGRIAMSVIWGLGLALIFFMQVCDGPQCIVLKAPPKSIEKDVYGENEKCYTFVPENSSCGKCPVTRYPKAGDQGGKCKSI